MRWYFLATLEAQQCQRAARIPTPAGREKRGRQRSLLESRLHRLGLQKLKHFCQREAVLLGESNIQAVICCSGLQLEVEAATKAFAQRQTPCLIDPSADRRMDHQLH